MEEIFRFRFQVYCNEKSFLPRESYPDGLERDEFDESATHYVVRDSSNRLVGYMRTVAGHDETTLPLLARGLVIDDGFRSIAPGEAAETSRMMIRSNHRHEQTSSGDSFRRQPELPTPPTRRDSDLIQIKLLRLAYREALRSGIRWFMAAMEPPLARRMRMMGFPFNPVGPYGDYLGAVMPHAMDLRSMEASQKIDKPDTWAFFANPAHDADTTTLRPGEWAMPPLAAAA